MIKSEFERVYDQLDLEIGSHSTSEEKRKIDREIIFELIAIENAMSVQSEIGINSRISTLNRRLTDPKLRIKINLKKSVSESKMEFKLTKKELEILALFPMGLSIKDMAQRLYLTEATIKSHMYAIYRKLEVNNRVQAIAKAEASGLLNF